MNTNIDKVTNAEALEYLDSLEPGQVGCLLTDPPYSSGGMFRSDKSRKTSEKYQSTGTVDKKPDFYGDSRDQRSYQQWLAWLMAKAWGKMADGAFAFVFTDWRQLAATIDAVQIAGFIYRGVVPWIKPNARPQKGKFRQNAEYVVWATKNAADACDKYADGYFIKSAPQAKVRIHATQKPLELLEYLLQMAPDGCTVLDPFAGSGATGVAAVKTGRHFLGCELSPEYADLANNWISQVKAEIAASDTATAADTEAEEVLDPCLM